MAIESGVISNTIFELVKKAVIELPEDVVQALRHAYQKEAHPIAKENLRVILENIQLAKQLSKPICQDTGIPIIFAKLGKKIQVDGNLFDAIAQGIKKATNDNILRPNIVEVLTRKNTGTNTGNQIPIIDIELSNEDYLELTFMPKGGGSENMSAFKMLTPAEGPDGVKKFVLETVINAGGKPCPPTIVGVGLGGTADYSLKLAKKALLRPIGQRNADQNLAKLEESLLKLINETGIGPMGLGGNTTSLDVFIEVADTHVAGLPAAICFLCWAARKATARIYVDNKVKFI
ncbi:MAG: fumarate hydratase [Euryarchaeota archaeon]|nr:fumarate hydratase [Euryarchaeota archaeon]